ncbi:subclass B1 metallo-beta-lactamase [bacterium]|nr:subclass B1 metallo-beta-lactamase [bacterium]
MRFVFSFVIVLNAVVFAGEEEKISDNLVARPLVDNIWVHTSYKNLAGRPFPSNGLIVVTSGSVLIVDTAWGDSVTTQLIKWIRKKFNKPIRWIVSTHFHDDRLGGIMEAHREHVPVIAYYLTKQLAEKNKLTLPDAVFARDSTLSVDDTELQVFYPGAGHSPDNIVVYVAPSRVLFGGCLVKSAESTDLGFTGDAVIHEWPKAVDNVMKKFPDAMIVIPGHGEAGGIDLLTHTLDLLKEK